MKGKPLNGLEGIVIKAVGIVLVSKGLALGGVVQDFTNNLTSRLVANNHTVAVDDTLRPSNVYTDSPETTTVKIETNASKEIRGTPVDGDAIITVNKQIIGSGNDTCKTKMIIADSVYDSVTDSIVNLLNTNPNRQYQYLTGLRSDLNYADSISHEYLKTAMLTTPVERFGNNKPAGHSLKVFPNPPNPNANLNYSVLDRGNYSLRIYDSQGRMIKNLKQGKHRPGNYNVMWNGTDKAGTNVASGNYVARLLNNGKIVKSTKITVVK